jgi:hypothetical protein
MAYRYSVNHAFEDLMSQMPMIQDASLQLLCFQASHTVESFADSIARRICRQGRKPASRHYNIMDRRPKVRFAPNAMSESICSTDLFTLDAENLLHMRTHI